MVIYNVSIQLEPGIEGAWESWMKETHIPEVMETGCFTEHKFCKILTENGHDGTTYVLQYHARSMDDYEEYARVHGPGLQQKTKKKFGDKYLAFRSLMESV
jgi:hypothetical protein